MRRAELETVLARLQLVRASVLYSYEAGEYPADMDPVTAAYVEGDGGLLNILDGLILLLADCLDWEAEIQRTFSELRTRAEQAETEVARYKSFCGEALCRDVECDRDLYKAALARVETLCSEEAEETHWTAGGEQIVYVSELRAALGFVDRG